MAWVKCAYWALILRGALALIDSELGLTVVQDMPVVKVGRTTVISEGLLRELIRDLDPTHAYVERVHSMPKQGVVSAFTFGMGYGLLRGVLTGLGVATTLVTPNEWKRALRVSADKGEARVIAGRLFPTNARDFARVRDDGRAEAVLLAFYGMRVPAP
jgi:crossover junction endodeoxyribonuclease RuvC